MVLSVKGQNDSNGKFDWANAIVDAAILALFTLFTTLGGLGITGGITARDLLAAGIAAGIQFFAVLAAKRGLGTIQTKTTSQQSV
jgi:hypothetical protein